MSHGYIKLDVTINAKGPKAKTEWQILRLPPQRQGEVWAFVRHQIEQMIRQVRSDYAADDPEAAKQFDRGLADTSGITQEELRSALHRIKD